MPPLSAVGISGLQAGEDVNELLEPRQQPIGLLSNIMNMVGVSAYYQTLVIGIVIILAVIIDRLRR